MEKSMMIKRERTESFSSTSSSNISSLLSVKTLRTMDQLNLLPHSKTHETMDTAPFTIDTEPFLRSDLPIHEQIHEKKLNGNEDKISHKLIITQSQLSPESLPTIIPEIKPQDKVLLEQ